MLRAVVVFVCATQASSCSIKPPRGLTLAAISTTADKETLLLQIDDFGDTGDWSNWEPRRSGRITYHVPTGTVEAASAADALEPQLSLGNFSSSPAVTDDHWSSVEAGPVFDVAVASHRFLLFTSTGNLYYASGSQTEPLPKPYSLHYLDTGLAARAYGEHAIVALPLMCCVCQSWAHFLATAAGWQPLSSLDDHAGEPSPAVDWRGGFGFRSAGKQTADGVDVALLLTRQNLSSGAEAELVIGAQKVRSALGWLDQRGREGSASTYIVSVERAADANTSSRLDAVAAAVEAAGGTVQSKLVALDMLIVEMEPSVVPLVEALDFVGFVEADRPVGIDDDSDDDGDDDSALGGGVIAGMVVGVVVCLGVAILSVWLLLRRGRGERPPDKESAEPTVEVKG